MTATPRTGATLRAVACALLAVLGLSACTNEDSDVAVAQPIDEILDGDIEVVTDPSGTTAVVEAATRIPVACAVIYGPDDDFGAVAVDDDMQGGAHEVHRPRLVGLEPGTEYQFVLQGSDQSGAFYRSEVMSFVTPEVSAPGTNVAPSATVAGVSSEFSDAFAAANAIDGDPATEWSSAGDGDNAWIQVDLGEPHQLNGLNLRSREMTDGTAITETFTVTVDDQEFGPFAAGEIAEIDATGRTVRFDAHTTTGGNTGALEVEIFAAD